MDVLLDDDLLAALDKASPAETADLIRGLPPEVVEMLLARVGRGFHEIPLGPAEQAHEIDPTAFRIRPHIDYVSSRLAQAVKDVEEGRNRKLAVSLPPRAGKSTLVSMYGPLWMMRLHPEWKFILASYDASLSGGWARQIREIIEERPELGIQLAKDGGAGSSWRLEHNGSMFSTSLRGGMTGRGARVMIIDDPIKDFVEAHSELIRENVWNWWLSTVQTRLEPPHLVIVVMTRWHEDDLIGRLLSKDYEGDPSEWEIISIPAIAEPDDAIGRQRGEPLLSPLLEEDEVAAAARWDDVKRSVGTYTFNAMYQQRPSPAKGAIFDMGWWRYWTMDPSKATEDGRVVYLDPSSLIGARWLDSWDFAFKEKADSDYVVGQRWCRHGANRYLIAQKRDRWRFTRCLHEMEQWATTDNPGVSPCGHLVHQRLVEEKANGAAIIDTLHDKIAGLKPITPVIGKEARARAVTPECESGNIYFPHPSDPGNEWVTADLIPELREFPHGMNDDQVDALVQALLELRDPGRGGITVPGQQPRRVPRDITRVGASALRRRG